MTPEITVSAPVWGQSTDDGPDFTEAAMALGAGEIGGVAKNLQNLGPEFPLAKTRTRSIST